MNDIELFDHTDTVNELLARYGVKFGIYKNNTFKEQLFPFDSIPRIIEKAEFNKLEKGLKQRVMDNIHAFWGVIDDDVAFLNATHSGIFVQTAFHGQYIKTGEEIGQIISPLDGTVYSQVVSPVDGVLFTIREYPVVDQGSLVARVLQRKEPYVTEINEGRELS